MARSSHRLRSRLRYHGLCLRIPLIASCFHNVTAMPYHLVERQQQSKNVLFRYADNLPHDTRNRIRRGPARIPFVGELPVSSRHRIPRVPPTRATYSAKHIPWESTWLIIFLSILITLSIAWALYLAYTRTQRAVSGDRPRSRRKFGSSTELPVLRNHHDHNTLALGAPSRSFSFGLSKRRKPPPPSLDLEASKPREGVKKGWWASLPSVVQGRGGALHPQQNPTVDANEEGDSTGSGWTSSSTYSTGAGARLMAQMVPKSMSSAVERLGWGPSTESLPSGMLGEGEEGSGLPVTEEREDGGLGLGRYFGAGGVGIRREGGLEGLG